MCVPVLGSFPTPLAQTRRENILETFPEKAWASLRTHWFHIVSRSEETLGFLEQANGAEIL